ncbi:hypothetical protein E4T42_05483 [Aureobasidium subglaciale]|nr:hypothetical protein E4T42_05483 [Aureobasidium subglaciale]
MDGFYASSSPMHAVLDRLRGPDIDDHLQLFETIDWTGTSLGPIDGWSQELATQIFLTMLVPNPQSLVLGEDKVVIYNQAYGRLIRDHNPQYFGTPIATWIEWAPYFESMGAIYKQVETTGRAYVLSTFPMVMASAGFRENVDFSGAVICLPPPLDGYLGTFTEITDIVASEKRASVLQNLVSIWKSSPDLKALWANILESVDQHSELFPFFALYSSTLAPGSGILSESSENDSEDFAYSLEGSGGTPDSECPRIPQYYDLGPEIDGQTPDSMTQHLRKAQNERASVLITAADIPAAWQSLAQHRGVGEACRGAVVCPSSSNRLSRVQAFLLLGLSTRDAYNESYQNFVFKLQGEFANIVASIMSAEEAARKKAETAKRLQLATELVNKELALRRKETELATVRVERITKIVDLANVAIFERDLKGRLVFANEAFYKLMNTSQDVSLHEDNAASNLPEEHWVALLSGDSRTFEMRCRNENWGLCSALPTRDEHGNIDAVIGVITDIESQKRAEEEAFAKVEALERVAAAERRFFKFLEILPAGVAILETDGSISFATDEWFRLSGHEHCAFDQVNWTHCIHEEDRQITQDAWSTLSVDAQPVNFQFRVRRPYINPAGEACGNSWMLCNGLPEWAEDGSVARMVTVITDISHLKFAETVQMTRVEEAVESKKHMLSFIDMTSHEIRNPLGAVIHCADSALESLTELRKLAPDQWSQNLKVPANTANHSQRITQSIDSGLDAVDTILSCSAHLKRIVDDTLTLSKLDANLLRISPSAVRTVSILQDLQKMSEVDASRLGVNLRTVIDPSLDTLHAEWMLIDPGRVMQVLINLTSNAVKFTKTKGGARDVTVRMGASLERPSDLHIEFSHLDFSIASALQHSIYDTAEFSEHTCYLWFTVEDTGIGMTPEEKSRIFSRFAQGSIKTYNTYGGSGLGLFISRKLVELQGGEVGVASEAGVGSTFAFYVKAHTTTPPKEDGTGTARAKSPAAHASRPGKIPVSVLIVEDNAVNQRVLEKQLTRKGYICHVANHGLEAIEFLKQTKLWRSNGNNPSAPNIDVVLMDVEMPVMNGLDCAKRIREYQRTGEMRSNLPIIAASANARAEQVGLAIAAGMDDSITKPFRIPDLTPLIDSYAGWARAQG